MNKTLLIFRHEIVSLVSRFSFWFGVLGLPLIGFIILGGVDLINHSYAPSQSSDPGTSQSEMPLAEAPLPFTKVSSEVSTQVKQVFSEEEDDRPQGFVDPAGLVKQFPSALSEEELIHYASQAEAQSDLDGGRLSAYFVIPEDYLEKGQVLVYSEDYNLFDTALRAYNISYLLAYNLLGGDSDLVRAVMDPIDELEYESIAPSTTPQRDRRDMWYFFLPYSVMMLFYISIMGSAGMLLNSIAKEKENRVMEVLLVSTQPIQLLLGKITGLGLVGLFQIVIWLFSMLALLALGGRNFPIPDSAQLPLSTGLWGVVFFVLGYLVYASLMAGVGALVPNLREASQATILVILPLMIPLFIIMALIEAPNSPVAIGLSLFPLTAPTTMMLRMASTQVPTWQPITASVGLFLTAILVVRSVAGLFRAQMILSGQPFKIKWFLLALLGK